MLLAVFAPLALARPKVPVWRELDLSVALGHVIQVHLIVVGRLVSIFSRKGLDDELALDCKEDMICCQGALGSRQILVGAYCGGCRGGYWRWEHLFILGVRGESLHKIVHNFNDVLIKEI